MILSEQWIFSSSKLNVQHSGLTNSSPRQNHPEKSFKNRKIKNLSIFGYIKLSYYLGFSILHGYLKNGKNGCGKTFCDFSGFSGFFNGLGHFWPKTLEFYDENRRIIMILLKCCCVWRATTFALLNRLKKLDTLWKAMSLNRWFLQKY